MENLEKFIRANRNSFDEKEPSEGHFERFRQKLEAQKPARKVNLFMVAAAAAFAGIVLTGTLGILYNNSAINKLNKSELSLSVLSPELKEVEDYYLGEINEKYNEISNLSKNSSPEVETEVNKVINDMNLGYYLLRKELTNNPKQERVVNALIEQYQVRIEMLDQIMLTLQKAKQLNLNGN
ncbi:MAG: hypothetical protein AB9846_11550 [Tenuifilaceae bacterium]